MLKTNFQFVTLPIFVEDKDIQTLKNVGVSNVRMIYMYDQNNELQPNIAISNYHFALYPIYLIFDFTENSDLQDEDFEILIDTLESENLNIEFMRSHEKHFFQNLENPEQMFLNVGETLNFDDDSTYLELSQKIEMIREYRPFQFNLI